MVKSVSCTVWVFRLPERVDERWTFLRTIFKFKIKIAVANRTGDTLAKAPRELHTWLGNALQTNDLILLNTGTMDISSREIRQQIASGKNMRNWLPEKVADYIQQHHLYQ